MKFALSLLAAVALTACAAESDTNTPAADVESAAPKAAKVSLAIEGMT